MGTCLRVPDKGKESVKYACAMFPSLLSGTYSLPHFVWDVGFEIVPETDEDEEEKKNGVAVHRGIGRGIGWR